MRFMILVRANKDSETGVLPDEKILSEMGAYNETLVKAGALLAAEGLQASSKGARVHCVNGKLKAPARGKRSALHPPSGNNSLWRMRLP